MVGIKGPDMKDFFFPIRNKHIGILYTLIGECKIDGKKYFSLLETTVSKNIFRERKKCQELIEDGLLRCLFHRLLHLGSHPGCGPPLGPPNMAVFRSTVLLGRESAFPPYFEFYKVGVWEGAEEN